jgi:protein ImuB
MKRFLSIWLPAWPVERLERHQPGCVPGNRPFALVEAGAHGLRITAVNTRAAADGLDTGTALADARAALPGLVVKPAEPVMDARALLRLARWSGRYGPARNRDGIDGLWIDTTGVAQPLTGGVLVKASR